MRLGLRRKRDHRSLNTDPVAHELLASAAAEGALLGHSWIGTEHLLIVLADDAGRAGSTLRRLDVDAETVRAELRRAIPPALDAEALATIGIDLEAVERRVDAAFGPGALRNRDCRPVMRRLKRVFEHAAGLAEQRGATITREDVLVGLVRVPDSFGASILRKRGVTAERLLAELG
jgi:ATP-dependent Clp protease ATP-binding subunit ClpA